MEKQEQQIYNLLCSTSEGMDMAAIQGIIEMPLEDIVNSINVLSTKGYVEFLQSSKGIVYKAIADVEANLLGKLDGDERIIYQFIKQADNKGIWTKDLKFKSNLHQTVITKVLKSLESKKIIKAVKSVKNSVKKVYMLYDLTPSRDITGGIWFTESELDVEFINTMLNACFKFIQSKSIPKNKDGIFSPNYSGYPTAEQVLKIIREAKITSTEIELDDMQSLLDCLVYDGRIERLIGEEIMYRALPDLDSQNYYTSIPCCGCPVYNVCHENGPVNPVNCEYLKTWLQF
ncbi:RNA polymerase Rpc34-like domain-containing protein [Rozella allomycis CSF55]|uniref:DNA-directed RNA polymerase III subunit RPC6 n=1 Tax=Rozella allomycis (strain CSF55) TaxID=988480 RepID=A0A075AS10_ROZAC|nr:RNA polymerase Rpc34-like domain-containing protein [Rozella allomycis CSF55]|eukprot:EPZ31333.1 RNA polymerase Rpc34-like domain-containing protein [Rozella allomycis CSF55]